MILCGTDFTGASGEAARAAASLAARLRVPMLLAHVLDFPMAPFESDGDERFSNRWRDLFQPEIDRRKKFLENEADRLSELGAEVEVAVVSGAADEALVALAGERGAQWIVVASLGRRSASQWRLGSVADRLALTSPVPVLVVRDARPFEHWSTGRDGGDPLKVVFGMDYGPTSDVAAHWVGELKTAGPCELVAAHVYDIDRDARRLGFELPQPASQVAASLESTLGEVFRARLADRLGQVRLRLAQRVKGVHVADQLVEIADDERADLLVVGTHQRTGLSRRWHASVTYSVLPQTTQNVLIVPLVARKEVPQPKAREFQRILAVTDLSEHGNRAVAYAYAMAPKGGRVVLLHVVQPVVTMATPYGGYVHRAVEEKSVDKSLDPELEEKLQRLVPSELGSSVAGTDIELAHDADVAEAVCKAAERLAADAICMGTHAHGPLASTLLGSVAQAVVRRSRRPVLLVAPDVQEA